MIAAGSLGTGCRPLTPPCAGAEFYVSAAAVEGARDGSAASPWASIAEALAHAPPETTACRIVTVHLLDSVHTENVDLGTRGLAIVGEGAQLQGRIRNSRGAYLSVDRLTIQDAADFGILQMGGELHLRAVTVVGTRLSSSDVDTGIGIRILNGAQASLDIVTARGNASSGVSIQGSATRVSAVGLTVEDNQIHPGVLQWLDSRPALHLGALEIVDGASFSGRSVTARANQAVGISVAGGARARFEASEVRDTADFNLGQGWYSAGLRLYGGEVELVNFDTSRALSGVHVINSYVTYRSGRVTENDVGITYFETTGFTRSPADYDPVDCLFTVIFRDNSRGIDTGSIILPPSGPAGTLGCRTVSAFEID